MTSQKKAYLLASLAVLFWSTVATAFKIGLQYQSVLHLIWIASVTSTLVFFLILIFQKKTKEIFRPNWIGLRDSALLGAFNPLIYYLILFKAYSLLPAQVAQPINMVWPIVLALLSVPFLKQKIRWQQIVAIFISFIGVFFISAQGGLDGLSKTNPVGILLALSSSILWSLYWIFNVRDKRSELTKLFWNFLFGSLYLSLAAIFCSDQDISWGPGLWTGIYVGFFELGFAYIFWMMAMQLSENNAKIGNLVFVAPFISLIFIHLFLNETIYYTTFIGLIFIIGGILFQRIKRTR